jgi:hypothetical protein
VPLCGKNNSTHFGSTIAILDHNMSLRIFEDAAEAPESLQQTDVSFPARLIFCAWASLVAVLPVLTTIYAAWGITNLFRGMTNAETAGAAAVLGGLSFFNRPLIIALAISALLAFAMAVVLALKPELRLASVGLPFSFGVPILAATPAMFLWITEATTLDVISGKVTESPVSVAQTISTLLFIAFGSSLLMQGIILTCAIVSLCIPVRKRTDALSLRRPFAWAVSGMLLLVFAAAYFVLV